MLKGDKMGKFFGLILLLGFSKLLATDYALVVGIDSHGLVGAKNDAKDMVTILKSRGVTNIKTLYNRKATKTNIINAFQDIVKSATSKDRVYFFFSGHGTSYYDPSLNRYPNVKKLLKNTGALVPYGAYQYEYNRLIVSSKHLAPLFRTLDKDRVQTIIMFDACFSGGAYKDGLHQANNHAHYFTITTKVKDYPYKHIVYISGATRSDYSAESNSENRGYFSLDLSNCFRQYSSLNGIRTCMLSSQLPSIVLPKTGNRRLFAKKDIIVQPKKVEKVGDELFDLAIESNKFLLYAKNKSGQVSKNYNAIESYSIYIKNQPSGYLALFSREENRIKIYYPNNKTLGKLNANSNKVRVKLKTNTPPNNSDESQEDFVGFLVDRTTATKLLEIYNGSSADGFIDKKGVKKVVDTLKNRKFYGGRFTILTHR